MAKKSEPKPLLYAGAAVVGLLAFVEYKKRHAGSSGAVAAPLYPTLGIVPQTISLTNLYGSAQAATVAPGTADAKPTGASSGGKIPPTGTLFYDGPRTLPGSVTSNNV